MYDVWMYECIPQCALHVSMMPNWLSMLVEGNTWYYIRSSKSLVVRYSILAKANQRVPRSLSDAPMK